MITDGVSPVSIGGAKAATQCTPLGSPIASASAMAPCSVTSASMYVGAKACFVVGLMLPEKPQNIAHRAAADRTATLAFRVGSPSRAWE